MLRSGGRICSLTYPRTLSLLSYPALCLHSINPFVISLSFQNQSIFLLAF